MLAVVAVGGDAEPGTPSRALVVVAFFTTLVATMVAFD
jgi:hypothetical protein